jgi:hypothetical protein
MGARTLQKEDVTMQASARQANHFELSGRLGTVPVHVTYDATTFGGGPQLQYTAGHVTLQFSGLDIRIQESDALGTLVSVTTENVPDERSTTFTMAIPTVHLDDGRQSRIKTLAIATVHKLALNPSTLTGQLQTYETGTLRGTADVVVP